MQSTIMSCCSCCLIPFGTDFKNPNFARVAEGVVGYFDFLQQMPHQLKGLPLPFPMCSASAFL